MSKRATSGGDELTAKHHCRISKVNQTGQSALYDNGAWEILKQFLTMSMSLSEMDDSLVAYLGDWYSEDDWGSYGTVENVHTRSIKKPSVRTSASSLDNHLSGSCVNKSHRSYKCKNMYILDEAEEDDEEEEYEEGDGDGDGDGMSVRLPKVMQMQEPSAKQRLAATFDDMASWFEQNLPSLSQSRKDCTHGAPESRMYLLDIQRTVTEHVIDHLWRKNFPVTLSAWVAGQIYVVVDSPKTITDSLHNSLYAAVKKYSRIMDKECGAVEQSQTTLPNLAWVRIRHGKYKGCIGKIFKSGQDTVEVLCPTRNFPYPMPQGCRALVKQSCLPKNDSVPDIIIGDEVVGWTFKGERYYMGLLLKYFHCDQLELLTSPHVDNIQLHLESRWDKPFLKKTVMAFAMQFLHVEDHTRVIKGSLSGELSKVISIDHTYGSACLEFTFHECPEEIEVRLQDVERVFRVGDSVRVIAGPYLGLEGHILQMAEDVFHICQVATKEVPPPDSNSIEIRDFIQVLDGKHTGKCGVVDWLSKGDSYLWFRDLFTPVDTKSGLSSISVPIAMVQQMDLMRTIQYTKERGYNVKPGDTQGANKGSWLYLGSECSKDLEVCNEAKCEKAQVCARHEGAGMREARESAHSNTPKRCHAELKRYQVREMEIYALEGLADSGWMLLDGWHYRVLKRGKACVHIHREAREWCVHAHRVVLQVHAVYSLVKTAISCHERHESLHCLLIDIQIRFIIKLHNHRTTVKLHDVITRSYLMLPARSITPPVEITPSGLSTSITDLSPSSSNGWASWSASPGDVDMVHDPASSINPSSSTSDPGLLTARIPLTLGRRNCQTVARCLG
ncbi:uncharacterized protein F5891DRAFT_979988 [Suillus fuscotomentosus]|uniref:KOW domain-containing protein n=1 Tax=Suillus fuscotomentosus TaxID=1912939 RepID=A0AAD4E6Q8_9AGAM|nr:uncharacterized protein F5891DRAFT_979988 [Suillus fuscotomentosus]KAG1900758.1 hypothetical protein F5891DRAFT_979988 [Suillus fuscotomentosus]